MRCGTCSRAGARRSGGMTGTDFEQTIFPGDGVVSEALNINNPNSLEVGPQRYFFNLLPTTIELLEFRVFEGRSVPAPGLSGPPPTLGDGKALTDLYDQLGGEPRVVLGGARRELRLRRRRSVGRGHRARRRGGGGGVGCTSRGRSGPRSVTLQPGPRTAAAPLAAATCSGPAETEVPHHHRWRRRPPAPGACGPAFVT